MMTLMSRMFAELVRRLIGERTKVALAVKRAQGVKLGRPRTTAGRGRRAHPLRARGRR